LITYYETQVKEDGLTLKKINSIRESNNMADIEEQPQPTKPKSPSE